MVRFFNHQYLISRPLFLYPRAYWEINPRVRNSAKITILSELALEDFIDCLSSIFGGQKSILGSIHIFQIKVLRSEGDFFSALVLNIILLFPF